MWIKARTWELILDNGSPNYGPLETNKTTKETDSSIDRAEKITDSSIPATCDGNRRWELKSEAEF